MLARTGTITTTSAVINAELVAVVYTRPWRLEDITAARGWPLRPLQISMLRESAGEIALR